MYGGDKSRFLVFIRIYIDPVAPSRKLDFKIVVAFSKMSVAVQQGLQTAYLSSLPPFQRTACAGEDRKRSLLVV